MGELCEGARDSARPNNSPVRKAESLHANAFIFVPFRFARVNPPLLLLLLLLSSRSCKSFYSLLLRLLRLQNECIGCSRRGVQGPDAAGGHLGGESPA